MREGATNTSRILSETPSKKNAGKHRVCAVLTLRQLAQVSPTCKENFMYKTGEKCVSTGTYKFIRYTDKVNRPAPTLNEREIPLTQGEVFPPIKSQNAGAYWSRK